MKKTRKYDSAVLQGTGRNLCKIHISSMDGSVTESEWGLNIKTTAQIAGGKLHTPSNRGGLRAGAGLFQTKTILRALPVSRDVDKLF